MWVWLELKNLSGALKKLAISLKYIGFLFQTQLTIGQSLTTATLNSLAHHCELAWFFFLSLTYIFPNLFFSIKQFSDKLNKIFWKKSSIFSLNSYRHAEANPDWPKNMLLLKNPLPLVPNHYETCLKWVTDEHLILTKFRNY